MGERNSGTNFVQALVGLNFDVEIVANTTPFTPEDEALIQKVPLSESAREAVFHRATDLSHQRDFHVNAGWKHACLTDRHFTRFNRADQTLFVCVLRHPALWLRSMLRAPFGTFYAQHRAETVQQLFDIPWITRPRDEIDAMVLETPALLWVHKTVSYLDARDKHPNVAAIRHEDLLRDPAPVLDTLAKQLSPKVSDWQIPEGNARGYMPKETAKGRDFHAIRAELPEDPWSVLGTDLAAEMHAVIGTDLLVRAGYETLP